MFRRHRSDEVTVADPNTALFFNPHDTYRVSHPLAIGDRCTVITLHRLALEQIAEAYRLGAPWTVSQPFRTGHTSVKSSSLLRLRKVTSTMPCLDGLQVEEIVTEVVAEALEAQRGHATPRPLPQPMRCHRAVERVRELAATRFHEQLTLQTFSELTGYSPFHLLRAFRTETGLPIRRYVNRLRLLHGLESLDTSRTLSQLALDLGFASHSHFTRAFTAEFGVPPSCLRRPERGPARQRLTLGCRPLPRT